MTWLSDVHMIANICLNSSNSSVVPHFPSPCQTHQPLLLGGRLYDEPYSRQGGTSRDAVTTIIGRNSRRGPTRVSRSSRPNATSHFKVLVKPWFSIYPGLRKSMKLEPLIELIHSPEGGEWNKRNDIAFRALFGSPDGRYPKAAERSVTLRAPEMSPDSGVPFAAYIHPANPPSGP